MAHVITTQVFADGPKNKVIKVNIKGASATATELVDAVIYDSSAYVGDTQSNKLMRVEFCLNGFSAELDWDATANVPLVSLDQDVSEDKSYESFGGIINNGAAGRTGDILITTTGLASTVKDGHIIFYIVQRDIPHIR